MSARPRLEIVAWPTHEGAVRTVRNAVFSAEQGIDPGVDFDGSDAGCLEAVAFDAGGAPVGTGRLKPDGHIGRIAVLPGWRGRGVGSRLLAALIEAARRRGLASVHLNAQRTATGFYSRHGFTAVGEPFEEAGISHVRMERALPD